MVNLQALIKGVGGELASLDQACPGTGFSTCTNLKERQDVVTGTQSGWLSNPYISSNAYRVQLASGTVDPNANRSSGNGQHALCR